MAEEHKRPLKALAVKNSYRPVSGGVLQQYCGSCACTTGVVSAVPKTPVNNQSLTILHVRGDQLCIRIEAPGPFQHVFAANILAPYAVTACFFLNRFPQFMRARYEIQR